VCLAVGRHRAGRPAYELAAPPGTPYLAVHAQACADCARSGMHGGLGLALYGRALVAGSPGTIPSACTGYRGRVSCGPRTREAGACGLRCMEAHRSVLSSWVRLFVAKG